jgi:hypothetical protein
MARCSDSDDDQGATLEAKVDPCPWTTPGFSVAAYTTDIENRRTSELQNVHVLSKPLFNEVDINRRAFVIHVYNYIPKKGGRFAKLHTLMPNSTSNAKPSPEKVISTATFRDELSPSVSEKLSTNCEFDVP